MTMLALLRHWKWFGLGLLCLLLAVQTVRLGHRTNQLEKERINSNELRAELKRISSKKNEQRVITVEKIKQVETIRREADKVAEKIEQAPLPGNCRTPDAVMGADL
jgi:biopolymer transport protein ExbB/TolQ